MNALSNLDEETKRGFVRWFKEHSGAVSLMSDLYEILSVWDDLIDRDKPLSKHDINSMMVRALLSVPMNPFYQANAAAIQAVGSTAICNWIAANEMERAGGERNQEIAFIIRSSYVDLVVLFARLIGGMEWACKVAIEARQMAHGEGLALYRQNLALELASQGD